MINQKQLAAKHLQEEEEVKEIGKIDIDKEKERKITTLETERKKTEEYRSFAEIRQKFSSVDSPINTKHAFRKCKVEYRKTTMPSVVEKKETDGKEARLVNVIKNNNKSRLEVCEERSESPRKRKFSECCANQTS